jgi:UDP-N-acetyl-D-galactosamine dehydrogenase|tara:strand:- start:362 stop:1624 length:1263 start_codon:yes stop_codon:yes gene_type:complete
MRNKICIIGLGYVGLPLALEFSKSFNVVGYDLSIKRIKNLSENYDDNLETEGNIITKNLQLTSDYNEIKGCNIYIIAVPTPIDSKFKPDISILINACKTVGKLIKKNDIVVIESTVYPGCTRNDCMPVVSKYSKLKANRDYFFGYSPERINPGDKIHTLSSIKKVISASDSKTLKKLKLLYGKIIKAGLHLSSTIEVAEAAKVIENTQRDLNIAFMNELSIIFSKMNISTKEVLEAASSKWNFLNFKPGLVGGHCIGVDPYYLTHISKKNGYEPKFLISGRSINNYMPQHIVKSIQKLATLKKIGNTANVLCLGLTFKENVSDLRNSKSFEVIDALKKKYKNIEIYDPLVNKNDLEKKYKHLFIEKKILILKKYSIIIFLVPHNSLLKNFSKKIYEFKNTNNIVVDITLKLNSDFVDIEL